jgi:hypothetical protein
MKVSEMTELFPLSKVDIPMRGQVDKGMYYSSTHWTWWKEDLTSLMVDLHEEGSARMVENTTLFMASNCNCGA